MKKWIMAKTEDKNKSNVINKLMREPKLANLSRCALEILYNRGYQTVDAIEEFLYSSINNIHDTRLLADSMNAIHLMIEAVKKGKHIVVYGDYDSDGICSTSLMVLGLRKIGAKVDYFTNNRFIEGYGMCVAGLEQLIKKFPTCEVIITVDNGIVAYEGINKAKELGLTVIVTDHHEQGDYLPNADAVVDPKRHDCSYPFKGLCGAGVAFKLLLLLYWELDKDLDYIYDMIDILGVATVGDMVPLVDENRIFVREGIKKVKNEERPVFKILREKTGLTNIDEQTFGFKYVPMLNAVGRMNGTTDEAIEMFVTDDLKRINEIVEYLIKINQERIELTEIQEKLGIELVESKGIKEVIVLYHPTFHEGVVGLVAGRLKEKYNRPTIVLSNHNGILKGSARSIDGLHIKNTFDDLREYLLGYGGHAMAGGLSLEETELQAFENAICSYAKRVLKNEDYIPKLFIDTVVEPKDITVSLVEELAVLKPFGMNFEKPNFGIKNFNVNKSFYMGNEKQHIKLICDGVGMIIFNGTKDYKNMGEPNNIKAVGYPGINVWKNNISMQFNVNIENLRGV